MVNPQFFYFFNAFLYQRIIRYGNDKLKGVVFPLPINKVIQMLGVNTVHQ